MQNMQYQTKLSPSYPQSYPQKGVTNCKVCSTPCKICSTSCKIRSTPCKICSTKQSYPQVIPRVIPKKVLPTAKCAVHHAKYAVPHAKYAVPHAKYAVQNKVIPKLSPELSPKRCYQLQSVQYHMQNIQYPMQNTQYPLQNMQYNLQNMQYQTKLSPSYPQSYPQWICRRKIDLKNKSKCFILT